MQQQQQQIVKVHSSSFDVQCYTRNQTKQAHYQTNIVCNVLLQKQQQK